MLILAILAAGLLTPAAAVQVTNNHDSGPGSFRSAILEANGRSTIRAIDFRRGIGRIELAGSVRYTGPQSLRIDGQGATLAGTPACDCNLLVADGGSDLALSELTVEDAPRSGIVIVVPPDATGVLEISLREVVIRNNGLGGLAVDDQTGDDGIGANSDAGIRLEMDSTVIAGNGFRPGFSDFDGVRIDEGGNGDVHARIHDSRFVENAGDGLELDERGPGSVVADVGGTAFDQNGPQPQNPADPEDGFDIDEADAGDVRVSLVRSTANGNFDQGVDLDEEGLGDIELDATRLTASGNVVDGIIVSEEVETEAAGNLDVDLRNVTASDTQQGDGIQLEEFGPGDFEARVTDSTIRDNRALGINVNQATPGEGDLRLEKVSFSGNGEDDVDANGVEVVQVP